MKFLVFIGLFCGIAAVYSQSPSNRVMCSDTSSFKSHANTIWGGEGLGGEIDLKHGVFTPAHLTVQPMFPGGTDSLRVWFQQNVRFPESIDTLFSEKDAYKSNILVFVKIDAVGKVCIKTMRGRQLDTVVTDEIKRLISILPHFSPGICRRREVAYHTTLKGGGTLTRFGPREIDYKVQTSELMILRFTTRKNVLAHYSQPTDTTRTSLSISMYKE